MTVMGKKDTDTSKAGNVDTTNLFFIVLALKNNSSESSPLSCKEIADIVNNCYKKGVGTITHYTVRRRIYELMVVQGNLLNIIDEDSKSKNDNEDDKDHYIIDGDFRSGNDNEHNLNFVIKGKKVGREYKFYYSSNFTAGELRFMADILWSAYKYDSEGMQRLLHKVSKLTPQDEELYELCHNPEELMGEIKYFERIETLSGLIKEKKYAEIISVENDNALNEVDQQMKIYHPIELLMLGGHYYCRVVSEDGIILLRVDRIRYVEEADAETIPESVQQDIQKIVAKHGKDTDSKHEYEITHYIAKEGKDRHIELLVRITEGSEIMDEIVDAFGSDLPVNHCEEKTVKEKLGHVPKPLDNNEFWVSIAVKNTQEGVVDFAARHCDEVAIISPASVRKALESKLRAAVNLI